MSTDGFEDTPRVITLVREGMHAVDVDGHKVLGGDAWASADDLASVDDDEVLHLSVDAKHLVR